MAVKRLDLSKLDVLSLMRFDACTRCGECTATCPTGGEAQEDELVTPRGKILRLREFYTRQYGLRAALLGPRAVHEAELRALAEKAYLCTICGQCKSVCPAHLDTIRMWENMREFLVSNSLAPLPAHEQVVKSIENYSNPWMQPRSQRTRWSRKLEPGVMIRDSLKERPEVLFFVGCTAAYDPNIREMALNTARVLSAAGIDFGTLGNDENCCGSTLLRTGLTEAAMRAAQANISLFEQAAPTTIVTNCAGCCKTLSQDYPRFGKIGARVVHATAFIAELLDRGKLRLTHRVEAHATYHDPCHLGRHLGLYEPPRKLLESIPGIKLIEMERTRDEARCCGAGGGVKTAFPDLAMKIAGLRVADAEQTGANVLSTSCPFCLQSLRESIEAKRSRLRMMDVMELVHQSSC